MAKNMQTDVEIENQHGMYLHYADTLFCTFVSGTFYNNKQLLIFQQN